MAILIEQVQDFFSTKQEWETFLELNRNKDLIRNNWFLKLKNKINAIPLPDGWGTISWGYWDYRWFIKDYGSESLCLWLAGNSLRIWANRNVLDSKKVYDLLLDSRYSLIKSAFDEIYEIYDSNNEIRFEERGNFSFDGEPASGNIDIDKMAWYANYKTNELAEQIIIKVNKFITNQNITKMFREIDEQCHLE